MTCTCSTCPVHAVASQPKRPLSRRQLALYLWMREYEQRHGMPATLRDMAEGIGVSSTNAVNDLLLALARKGVARNVHAGKARGWRTT